MYLQDIQFKALESYMAETRNATNRLVWHVKISLAATKFCCRDLSHEFKLVWIRATYRSDKISASSLVAACVRICASSLRQNLNQPMREHQLVSRHAKFELVYISSLPKSIACTVQVSYCSDLWQHQCRRGDLSPRFVASYVSAYELLVHNIVDLITANWSVRKLNLFLSAIRFSCVSCLIINCC